MKYSDLHNDEARHKDCLEHIERRWNQLHALDVKHGDAAVNYLMIVSGGSAAATLTFIGNAMKDGPAPGGAVLMLGCFALSILCVGLMKARMVYHVRGIFMKWRVGVKDFIANKVEWDDLLSADEIAVADKANLVFYLGWAALIFWCVGVGIGFVKLQGEPRHVKQESTASPPKDSTDTASQGARTPSQNSCLWHLCTRQEVGQHRHGSCIPTAACAAKEEVTNPKEKQ